MAGLEPPLDRIYALLRDHPDGLREYQLYRLLRAEQIAPWYTESQEYPLQDPLTLFRLHFLLFHLLYQLRDRLLAAGQGDLSIHCLAIVLYPTASPPMVIGDIGDHTPATHDPLRAYYLDLNQLHQTDAAAVRAMLDGFWRRYLGQEQQQQALQTLGLTAPAGREQIKQRYHHLARRHHPDCGGDAEQFRRIHEAAEQLLQAHL
ncbi:MAG: DnaJ domain-containing protein [Magnetococcales bacterium]|nr:DnaJ domain-containing protein [Magnetococcales bacterium]